MEKEIIHNPVTGETLHVLESSEKVFKILFRLGPDRSIAGEHFHPWQRQKITVLSGELHCRVGKKRFVIRAGETTTIPAGKVHHQWNPTDAEVVAIEELRPGSRFHQMFRVLFALAWDGKTDLEGVPHPLIGAAFLAEFKDVLRPARLSHRLLFGSLAPLSRLLGYHRIIQDYIREFESSPARGHLSMMNSKNHPEHGLEVKAESVGV